MSKSSSDSFEHQSVEHLDALVNYLSMLSRGLKKRKVSLNQDEQSFELQLPDEVKFTIKAKPSPAKKDKKGHKKKSKSGKLSFKIEWDEPKS